MCGIGMGDRGHRDVDSCREIHAGDCDQSAWAVDESGDKPVGRLVQDQRAGIVELVEDEGPGIGGKSYPKPHGPRARSQLGVDATVIGAPAEGDGVAIGSVGLVLV